MAEGKTFTQVLGKWLAIGAMFSVSLFIGILLCEGVVRVIAPQRIDTALDIYDPDPDLIFKMRPNYSKVYANVEFEVPVTTNALGLRDKEIGSKPEGVYRILGLGDSFSFANGVLLEETYFKQLEARLNGRDSASGRRYEVVNCAVPANSLLQELRFLKKYGERFEADAVIVGFYVGNDFIDSYELFDEKGIPTLDVQAHYIHSVKSSDEDPNFIRRVTQSGRIYLAMHSHLYVLLRNSMADILVQLGLRAPPPPPEFCAVEYSEGMKKGWDLTKSLLKELGDFARSSDLRLHVAILPTIYQVYQDVWDRHIRVNNIDPTLYDLEKPQKLLAEYCGGAGIPVIDLLPALRHAAGSDPLYYEVDSHMNPAGHRIVADSISQLFFR